MTTMSMPAPLGINTYHTKPYSTIQVTRPELSAAEKVVLITGGGSGLGFAFSEHFAKAGCKKIAITGRREKVLQNAKEKIESFYPGTSVLTLQSDVADREGLDLAFKKAFDLFGPIHVLISNAGYLPEWKSIGEETSFHDWWNGFETNVKGPHNVLSAFLKTSAPDATVLNIVSGAVNTIIPGQSAYSSSKIASTRLFEVFQKEYPRYRVINVAPGIIMTPMHEKTVAVFAERGWPQLPLDDSMAYIQTRKCSQLTRDS
jgi:NAD(P)-dependent dehydrogenase (short-subunit alcohol dehydrogenase family)